MEPHGRESASGRDVPVRDGQGPDLLAAIEWPDLGVFACLSMLVENAANVGVCFQLCQRLRQYAPEDVEFYLAQLVQIYVTVETESAALEDLLMDMCRSSTHCMLMVFWHLQAALTDMAAEPQSPGFIAAKRLYNKLQFELFAFGSAPTSLLRENTAPAIVLASMVAACMVPGAGSVVKPLVVSQGRRQRSYLLRVANKIKGRTRGTDDDEASAAATAASAADRVDAESTARNVGIHGSAARSMPNLSSNDPASYEVAARRMSSDVTQADGQRRLKMNYFRSETQFLYSLQSIANRLVSVPRQARLSALQLELALLNRDLPADVDIPELLPKGSLGRQARIVRISPAEATVLNSAEKAPFLLLVEILRDDITFSPATERNKRILSGETKKRYLFDGTLSNHDESDKGPQVESVLPIEEKDMADFSLAEVEGLQSEDGLLTPSVTPGTPLMDQGEARPARSSHSPKALPPAGAPLSEVEVKGANFAIADDAAGDITGLATQMRTANIILSQLEGLEGSRLPRADVAAIKAKIIANMESMRDNDVFIYGEAGERKLENDLKTAGLSSSDDPSAANLAEDWNSRRDRIRQSSPYGQYPNWDLFSVIVKTGDDLRQEALASQLIQLAQRIWRKEGTKVWVRKMGILITGSNSGLVETITNCLSVHSIKKALTTANTQGISKEPSHQSDSTSVAMLSQHFEAKFGLRSSRRHQRALQNFVSSLAGYSLLCYLLQIKDRHNGNILLDNEGHIIHIDFGFMLSNSPGRFGFEAAPFKLTTEYIDIIGGLDSELYKQFVALMKDAFKVLRRHADDFVRFVDIMSRDSSLPCFQNGPSTSLQLRQRFQLHLSDEELDSFVENVLIFKSYRSMYTRLYDQFQMVTQGIYS